MKPILAASAALALYLGGRSWGWPLVHDAPLMHYVAWLIGQGAVPYRDVFDMNMPGVYLLHLGVIGIMGEGDRAWRLFDLAWLALTAAALFGFARRAGDAWSGLAAALLFVIYHLSGGAWRAGQRDFLLTLFLVLAAWGAARAWESGGALLPLFWSGLAAGAHDWRRRGARAPSSRRRARAAGTCGRGRDACGAAGWSWSRRARRGRRAPTSAA